MKIRKSNAVVELTAHLTETGTGRIKNVLEDTTELAPTANVIDHLRNAVIKKT